jgi:hypothetical protein
MSHKRVGSCIYIHKSNIQELLDMLTDDGGYKGEIIYWYNFRKQKGTAHYEVIKYDIKKHRLSFIDSPDWFTSNEPTVGNSTCWDFDKETSTYRSGGTQVYHSKELFMADDTDLIDLNKAKERTKLWQSVVKKEEKKLIGNKKYWHNWCEEHGIEI